MRVAQFFEVQSRPGHVDTYLELAASLRPALDRMGGCLSIDRFRSFSRPDLLLSYQIWHDEAMLVAWRAHGQHHAVQCIGREKIFSDYRIRVAQVVREQFPGGETWTPARLSAYNDPARRPPTFVVIAESSRDATAACAVVAADAFESVYRPGRFLHLFDVPSLAAGTALGAALLADAATDSVRVFEVYRDYGMFDRREAPQYYPPVTRCPHG